MDLLSSDCTARRFPTVRTEPLIRETAVESLSAVRRVVSVIPLKEPVQGPARRSALTLQVARPRVKARHRRVIVSPLSHAGPWP
jgi:hypothetical protein